MLFISIGFSQKGFETTGDYVQIALPSTAFITHVYSGEQKDFIYSFLTTMAVTHSIKFALNRQRPKGGKYSFPSGHSAASFTGAYYIHRKYGSYYGATAFLAAGYVAWSRVKSRNHYITDVVAGASIGLITSYLFDSKRFLIQSKTFEEGTKGIKISFAF